MSEFNEQSKPKKQRQSRGASTLMSRAVRKILKQKAPNPEQPDCKEIWAEKVGANLINIASEKKSAVGLQAIKMVMDQVGDALPVGDGAAEFEPRVTKASLRGKSDEELEAEIKELQGRLGSIVTASA